MSLFENLAALLTLHNVFLFLGGSFLGILGGALPGVTSVLGLTLLSSVTFGMESQDALLALLALYVGSVYGGSLSAITLNIPGTPASAATSLDGYPLTLKGEAGPAIGLGTIGSFVGTLIGVLLLATLTPILGSFALQFSSVEFFLLAVMGILMCGSLSSQDWPEKGWLIGFLGFFLSTFGMDEIHAYPRFVFGNPNLLAGIPFIPVMIGIFGIPEVVEVLKAPPNLHANRPIIVKRVIPRLKELKNRFRLIVQSGLVAVGVGIIPGVGEDIGSWVSYDLAKRTSKNKDEFGKGSHEGLLASEIGNNATIGGAIIPLLALGIPGSPPAAILLGAMILHGLRPGPLLLTEQPEYLSFFVASLIYASFSMLIIGLLFARWGLIYVIRIPKKILVVVVASLCIIGAFSLNMNLYDVKFVFIFGIVGVIMRRFKFPAAPFVLGFILGPFADGNLRRALYLSNGNVLSFFHRPVAAVLVVIIVVFLLAQAGVFQLIRKKTTGSSRKADSNGAKTSGGPQEGMYEKRQNSRRSER